MANLAARTFLIVGNINENGNYQVDNQTDSSFIETVYHYKDTDKNNNYWYRACQWAT